MAKLIYVGVSEPNSGHNPPIESYCLSNITFRFELDVDKLKCRRITWLKSFVNESIDSLACQIPSQICGRWCLTDGNWHVPEEGWTSGICKTVSSTFFARPETIWLLLLLEIQNILRIQISLKVKRVFKIIKIISTSKRYFLR